jgi:hypothetical protein
MTKFRGTRNVNVTKHDCCSTVLIEDSLAEAGTKLEESFS